MATQLIIDSITKMAIVYKDKDQEEKLSMNKYFEYDFLHSVYELSVIRSDHFKESSQLKSFNPHGRDSSFFLMALQERACLFLRDKMNLSFNDISYIIGVSYEESLAITHRSRGQFIDLIEHSNSHSGESYAQ